MLQTQSYGAVEITSVDREALLTELEKSARLLAREAPEVEDVRLFGSFVRGDYTPESDVDVLIVVDRSELPYLERPDRYRDFFFAIPLEVNLLVYTRAEARRLRRDGASVLGRIWPETLPLIGRRKKSQEK